MRQLLVLLSALTLLSGLAMPATAHAARQDSEDVAGDVQRAFEEVLDLWREGRYAEVYDRTAPGGKETRESFSRRLKGAPLRPACCWEKLQEVRVTAKGPTRVLLRGKVGLEGAGNTEYKTRAFTLQREGDTWLVARNDLLALAEAGAKKGRRKARTHFP